MVYICSVIFRFLLCVDCFSIVLCCMATPSQNSVSVTATTTTTKRTTTTTAATTTTTTATCSNTACNNACINRGCQTGTCNIGCTTTTDPNAPCNPVYVNTCTCDFCTTTPCAQPDQITGTFFDKTNCISINCQSGDCFEGITQCVGCPADNIATPTSVPVTTSSIGTCTPSACASFCQQHGCATGGCDLFYQNQASNPCACSICISPSQTCTQAACNAACTAAGFGCRHGSCDQGICDCFICPDNAAGK